MLNLKTRWQKSFKTTSVLLSVFMLYQTYLPLAYAIDCIENLSIRAKTSKNQLTWTDFEAANHYEIFRGLQIAGPFEKISETDSSYSTYLDTPLTNDILYYYRVQPIFDNFLESCQSDVIAGQPPSQRTRLAFVPNVEGLTFDLAEQMLNASFFQLGTIVEMNSATVPEGHIILQDPPKKSHVPRNFPVGMIVSTGIQTQNPPSIEISEPLDGSEFNDNESIIFSGVAEDIEDGNISGNIVWASSIDNQLGQDASISTSLTVGTHTITATITDNDGLTASDQITIDVVKSNAPPVADAGIDQTALVNDLVTLDGSRSTDPDGDALTFSWSLISQPSNSTAQLNNAASVNPELIIDLPGNYEIELIVNDGEFDSTPDTVVISTENSPPIADAGRDQTVFVGDFVTLNGSDSSDPDGDPLTFLWNMKSVPMGSTSTLSDATAVMPNFEVDRFGIYEIELIVNDGTIDSAIDIVVIATENSPPIANAGPDQTSFVTETVILDGSSSSDVDGDSLTFVWSMITHPEGSKAVLDDPAAVNPSFVVDKPGTYVNQLTVNDGNLNSAPDTIVVTTENSPPVADAGPEQRVAVDEVVTLDGSGSTDVDGDSLQFFWAFTSTPTASHTVLSDDTAVMPTFTVDVAGMYTLQLIVNDGTVDSLPDTVTVATENSAPVADAGADQTVFVTNIAQLDGSGSSDVDGDPITYQWSIVSLPTDSNAFLDDPMLENPSFTVDKPGTYLVQLIVNDGLVDSQPDTVMISTQNSKPVADGGPDQRVFVEDNVILDGSNSHDVDGDELSYQWSFTSKPVDSTAILSDSRAIMPTFDVDKPGTYVVQLIVNDGLLDSDPNTLVLTTINRPPIANAGDDQSSQLGNTITLDGSASKDPDGDPISFSWEFISKPTASVTIFVDPTMANPSFLPDLPGEYEVQLIVNDGNEDSVPDTVLVTVNNRRITVPDVIGLSQTEAEASIIASNLTVGAVSRVAGGTVLPGKANNQNPTAGTVVAEGSTVDFTLNEVVLIEDSDFEVVFEYSFTVPRDPSFIQFTYADLVFDTADSFVNDAFEAALVDASGFPLIHPIIPDRDAAFNITEGIGTSNGVNTVVQGNTVKLDLAHIPADTTANLILRLVNNDNDTTSTVRLTDITLFNETLGTPAGAVLTAEVPGDFVTDFTGLTDVTASISTAFGQTSFNRDTAVLHTDLALANSVPFGPRPTLLAVIENISEPNVTARGFDGRTPSGHPYFNFTNLIGQDNVLEPGETSGKRTLRFNNPDGIQFSFDVTLLSRLNRPPAFTSTPIIEALAEKPYAYDAQAEDPDRDVLQFMVMSGPAGLTVDPSTGQVSWAPTTNDMGNHTVSLKVEDNRGGQDFQDFTIRVRDDIPNRPPYFVTLPVVEASLNGSYAYDSEAEDPDLDPSTYALLVGPEGMTIDPATGLVEWTPNLETLGLGPLTEAVTIAAADGRGGTAKQVYTIVIGPQEGNDPPIFVSHPVTKIPIAYDTSLIFGMTSVADFGMSSSPPARLFSFKSDGSLLNTIGNIKLNKQEIDVDGLAFSGELGLFGFHIERDDDLNVAGSTLVAIDPVTAVAEEIGLPLSRNIRGAAFDHSGNLWVLDSADASLLRIDPLTGAEISGSEVLLLDSGNPISVSDSVDLAIDESGQFYVLDLADIYTLDPVSGELTLIRSDSGQVMLGIAATVEGNLATLDVAGEEAIFTYELGTVGLPRSTTFSNIFPEVFAGRGDLAAVSFPKYEYDADALDPNDDPLSYALTQNPNGMTIDPDSGLIEFHPPLDFLSKNKITFSDSQMDLANYTIMQFESSTGGTIEETERVSEGNPGEYTEFFTEINGDVPQDEQASISRVYLKTGAEYDPAVQGGIFSVDYSMDTRTIGGNGGQNNQNHGIALQQNGKLYIYQVVALFDTNWHTESLISLAEEDFSEIDFSPKRSGFDDTSHPDFSETGSPIEWGFTIHLGHNTGSTSILQQTNGYDNWNVSITPFAKEDVSVVAEDSKGGQDTQNFQIRGSRPGTIQGFAFEDEDKDGIWNRGPDLLANAGGSVFRLARKTGALIERLGEGIIWFDHGPDGDLYVLRKKSSHKEKFLDRYDEQTSELLETYTLTEGGNAFVFGPDEDLFVSDVLTDTVLRYDGSTFEFKEIFATTPGLDGPLGLAFGPDGNLYATGTLSSFFSRVSVYRFDGQTGALIDPFIPTLGSNFGPHHLVFGPDGHLYVSQFNSSNVLRFNGTTGAFIDEFIPKDLGGLEAARGIAFSPEGEFFAASSRGERDISRYSGTTGAFIDIFFDGNQQKTPIQIDFSPDGLNGQEEDPLPGFSIFLDRNRNGVKDPGEPATITDENGQFVFTGLPCGPVRVVQETKQGFVKTTPFFRQVEVREGKTEYKIDFGNRKDIPVFDNEPPQIISTPPNVASVEQTLLYNAEAFDPNSDPLSWSLLVSPNGMTIDPLSGIVAWVPKPDQRGKFDVLLQVEDGRGERDSQNFIITVGDPNTAPVITSVPNLSTGPDFRYTYNVAAQDAQNDVLTYSLDTAPAGMTIDENSGKIEWLPSSGDIGDHTVNPKVTDDQGAFDTQTYTLSVQTGLPNEPPVIHSTPRDTIQLGRTYLYRVEAEDPDGDTLIFSLNPAPIGMTVDTDGMVSWKPTADQFGPNSIGVIVDDGHGNVIAQNFNIEVVSQASNTPPQITSDPSLAAIVSKTYSYDISAVDPDGDPVFFALDTAPFGMSINPERGTVRWIPAVEQIGTHPIVLSAVDAQGGIATQSFEITVRAFNVPPIILSGPNTEASANRPYQYRVRALDSEGGKLTSSLVVSPEGMTIDSQTHLVEWVPGNNDIGTVGVSLRVTDDLGASTEQTYQILVVEQQPNTPPTITSTPFLFTDRNPNGNTVYNYLASAIDSDGDALTFSLSTAPQGASVDPQSGSVHWLIDPNVIALGSYDFTLVVTDFLGATATQNFRVGVLPPNQFPVINGNPTLTAVPEKEYVFDVIATDPDGDTLFYTLDLGPTGMEINTMGRVTWFPEFGVTGAHPVNITVRDGRGGSDSLQYTLMVVQDNVPPEVFLALTANPSPVNQSVGIQVQAFDDVGIADVTLTLNGQTIPLDSNNVHFFTPDTPGSIVLEAMATDLAGNQESDAGSLSIIDPNDVDAPLVEIITPENGATITSPVDVIGTVKDDNLLEYTLEIRPFDGGESRVIARGTDPVDGRFIGELDPTLLQNDNYLLRLKATDLGGNTSQSIHHMSVRGNLKLGNFRLDYTDLDIPLSGIPITITRSYDTLDKDTENDLGFGWRLDVHDTDLRTNVPSNPLEEAGVYTPFFEGARVYITTPSGGREGFTFRPRLQSGLKGSFLGLYEPHFESDPGVTSKLTVQHFDLNLDQNGTAFLFMFGFAFNPGDPALGGKYTLTTAEGLSYTINGRSGDLEQVQDPNGNTISFTPGGIFSSLGTRVLFERDSLNRISAVIDPKGNRITYEYDDQGNLSAHIDPEGNKTLYRYGDHHFLSEIVDPLGNRAVRTEYNEDGRIISILDAKGNPLSFSYDTNVRRQVTTDPFGNARIEEYDQEGNLVGFTDPQGNRWEHTYDKNGNRLSTRDPLGRELEWTYDSSGNLLAFTNNEGGTGTFTYDENGNVILDIDPEGNIQKNEYDEFQNLVRVTKPGGGIYSFEYDEVGNVITQTDSLGHVTTFAYNSAGYPTSETDSQGNETIFTYDANGNQLSQSQQKTLSNGTTQNLVTLFEYDARNLLTREVDSLGHEVQFSYNHFGSIETETDARGTTTRYEYDANNLLSRIVYADGSFDSRNRDLLGRVSMFTDRDGRSTQLEYDELHRITKTIHPDGTSKKNEYDALGRILAEVDEKGNTTHYIYDSLSTRIVDPEGNLTTSRFDKKGNLISQSDANDAETQFFYDAESNLLKTIFPNGTIQQATYDREGNKLTETDPLGNITRYEYDALGQMIRVVDPLGNVTNYSYDEVGNLLTRTDALNRTTSMEYDELNRMVKKILPLGQTEMFQYDANGNVTLYEDFNGEITTFEYDRDNRQIQSVSPEGVETITSYSSQGLRTRAGGDLFEYDDRGRIVSEMKSNGHQIAYEYDDAGNLIEVSVAGATTFYTYDRMNRMMSVSDGTGDTTLYSYDAVGNQIEMSMPNGIVAQYEYNKLNQVTFLEYRDPSGNLISSFRYTFDAAGRRIQVEGVDAAVFSYDYDPAGRLIRESLSGSAGDDFERIFQYDAIGNRVSVEDASGVGNYTYDFNDRLLSSPDKTFTYDDNGNTLTQTDVVGQTRYQYDFQNRLVQVQTPTATIDYSYDADGNRIQKSVNGVATDYVVDKNREFAQVLATMEGNETTVYRFGNTRISQDKQGEDPLYYLNDAQGSVRQLSDGTAQLLHDYDYDAFGNLIYQEGSSSNVFLYRGEQFDADTGLYYLRARYYQPAAGRFLTVDPFSGILPTAGTLLAENPFETSVPTPTIFHQYLYANSDPVNRFDPSGLTTINELETANAGQGILMQIYTRVGGRFFVEKAKNLVVKRVFKKFGDDILTEFRAKVKKEGAEKAKEALKDYAQKVARQNKKIACAILEALLKIVKDIDFFTPVEGNVKIDIPKDAFTEKEVKKLKAVVSKAIKELCGPKRK